MTGSIDWEFLREMSDVEQEERDRYCEEADCDGMFDAEVLEGWPASALKAPAEAIQPE